MYFFVVYWVFSIITTVGYGEFVGGATAEYLVSLLIELTGFIVFSILSMLMEQLVVSLFSYEKMS